MSISDSAGTSGSILMNFSLPKTLKADFQAICREQHISMTARLNLMIRTLVEAESKGADVTPAPKSAVETHDPLPDGTGWLVSL